MQVWSGGCHPHVALPECGEPVPAVHHLWYHDPIIAVGDFLKPKNKTKNKKKYTWLLIIYRMNFAKFGKHDDVIRVFLIEEFEKRAHLPGKKGQVKLV